MNSIVISITLYMLSANLVAGVLYMFGQKKAGLLWIEYPFIYVPLLMFQILMPHFMGIPDLAESELALKYFLFMLQGFSCGLIGGMILLPRFFFPATTVAEKLKITMLSCVALSMLYLVNRWLFFEALRWLIPQMRGA